MVRSEEEIRTARKLLEGTVPFAKNDPETSFLVAGGVAWLEWVLKADHPTAHATERLLHQLDMLGLEELAAQDKNWKDNPMCDQIPRRAFLAALAELGDEPNWKGEYAQLYRSRYHQPEVEELNRELAADGFAVRLEITVLPPDSPLDAGINFRLIARRNGEYFDGTGAMARFESARMELLNSIQKKLTEEAVLKADSALLRD